MIWFTSDTHYSHKNICRGISEWVIEENRMNTRDFNTLEEMNNAIVNGINSVVQQDDTLYFLGDWSFGGIENIWNFRKRIVCKIIHFVLGNHDQHIKKNREISILPHEKEILHSFNDLYTYINNINCKELFTSVQGYLELEIDKQLFVLSHYPMEQWLEMDRKNGIMLHGHCHHTIDNCETNTIYKRMDVGIDWKEFRPYSIEEVLGIMNKRKLKQHINEIK